MTAPKNPHVTTAADRPQEQATLTSDAVSIQAVPPKPTTPPVQQTAPEKAPRLPPTPEQVARRTHLWDLVLVGMVLVLAFFLGSFRVHNSDLWLHLATGRLIATGAYQFGADPFTYTAPETPWYNTAWLSDLITYWLAGAPDQGQLPVFGGALLVLARALLLVATAVVLLRTRRRDQGLWVPAVCAALALVVMSHPSGLQSVSVSYLFLALTVYLLRRRTGGEADTAAPRRSRAVWLVPVLCALWVNLDSWFLLGPLTVGLFLVAELLQQSLTPAGTAKEAPAPGRLGTLALVLLLSLGACALNPHFLLHPGEVYPAALLPADLWAAVSDSPLKADRFFGQLFLSPLQTAYYTNPNLGANVAGLAYYVLLLLSLLSFLATYEEWRWWRAALWFAFGALSLFAVTAIPFFAVVAGPVLALNLQGYIARRWGGRATRSETAAQWAIGGRMLTAVAGATLLVAAWPGWLHGNAYDPRYTRHVAWSVVADPSLRGTARRLAELRADGALSGEARGFNFTPAVANYCAWFCPEEKGFYDLRFERFPARVARQYVELREALKPRQAGESELEQAVAYDWQQLFREQGINHVVMSTVTRDNHQPAQAYMTFIAADSYALRGLTREARQIRDAGQGLMAPLWPADAQWSLQYADGRSSIHGWKDPQGDGRDPFAGRHFNLTPLAFGPKVPDAEHAPDGAPEPPVEPDTWIDDLLQRAKEYWQGPAAYPAEADRAYLYYIYFHHAAGEIRDVAPAARRVLGGALSSTLAPAGAVPASVALLEFMLPPQPSPIWEKILLYGQDVAPPAAPLLAVRAARRAIAESPNNAQGYEMLAVAYQQLWDVEEQPYSAPNSPMQLTRHFQIMNALATALTLDPGREQARLMLAKKFEQAGFVDLALEQYQEQLRLAKEAGPRPGEKDAAFEERMRTVELSVQEFERSSNLKQRRTEYELRAKDKRPALKLQLALKAGLGRVASDIVLNESDPTQLGPPGLNVALMVLVQTGQAALARHTDLAESERDQLFLAEIFGEYQKVDEYLGRMIDSDRDKGTRDLLGNLFAVTWNTDASPAGLNDLNKAAQTVREEADLLCIRGIFALEWGHTAEATRHFRQAMAIGFPRVHFASSLSGLTATTPLELLTVAAGDRLAGPGANFDFETRRVAARYLELLRQAGN